MNQSVAMLAAGMILVSSPLTAQVPGAPPALSEGAGRELSPRPPVADAPHGLPPAESLQPLGPQAYPYKNRPLRDPFWTVGYYPPRWDDNLKPKKAVAESEWRLPTTMLKVSGVSRMGSRVMAIVNNELKKVGDTVEISYLGKVFQWKVGDIQADGNVRFERLQIINDTR